MSFRIDTSELNRLAFDFEAGPGRVQRRAPELLARSARRVKSRLTADATGHRHLKELPSTTGSDRKGLLDYEVGFDKRGQGNLANILTFGSVNNAPIMKSPLEHALLDAPRLVREAEDVAEGAALGDD